MPFDNQGKEYTLDGLGNPVPVDKTPVVVLDRNGVPVTLDELGNPIGKETDGLDKDGKAVVFDAKGNPIDGAAG